MMQSDYVRDPLPVELCLLPPVYFEDSCDKFSALKLKIVKNLWILNIHILKYKF